MPVGNTVVAAILRSPLHPLLSAKVQLVRYRGARTGEEHRTPTQYVELPDGRVAVLVGRPDTKTWWRNFRRPHPIDLLVRGRWRTGTGHARWRHDDPATVDAALDAFAATYGRRHAPEATADPLIVLVDLAAPA